VPLVLNSFRSLIVSVDGDVFGLTDVAVVAAER
jgi:hypothetical protein